MFKIKSIKEKTHPYYGRKFSTSAGTRYIIKRVSKSGNKDIYMLSQILVNDKEDKEFEYSLEEILKSINSKSFFWVD